MEVLYILIVVVTWMYTFVKTHWTVHFKCIKCKLCLNEVDFLKSFLLTPLTLPATLVQDSWRNCVYSLSPIPSHIFSLKFTPVRLLFSSCHGNCSHQDCSALHVAKSTGQFSFLSHILFDLEDYSIQFMPFSLKRFLPLASRTQYSNLLVFLLPLITSQSPLLVLLIFPTS